MSAGGSEGPEGGEVLTPVGGAFVGVGEGGGGALAADALRAGWKITQTGTGPAASGTSVVVNDVDVVLSPNSAPCDRPIEYVAALVVAGIVGYVAAHIDFAPDKVASPSWDRRTKISFLLRNTRQIRCLPMTLCLTDESLCELLLVIRVVFPLFVLLLLQILWVFV
jgi:hypothetical protein